MAKLISTLFIVLILILILILISCSKKSSIYQGKGELVGMNHKSSDMAGYTKDKDNQNTEQYSRSYGIEIEKNDKLCKTTKDCTSVAVRCSGHCGGGVNKKHLNKYQKLISNKCKSYKGPQIKIACHDFHPMCAHGVCKYAKMGLLKVFDD